MNILLTNDDGFDSVGIRLVKEKLSKYGHVIIVAPKGPMSAKSCSKTFGVPLKLVEEEKDIYSLTGSPADCVCFGVTSLNIKFDLVVSGVNNGLNIANDILYSGTIGACSEALTYGIPAMALSCDFNFELVEKYFDDVWKYVTDNKLLSKEYIVNVNWPVSGGHVKGIKLAKVHYRKDNNFFTRVEDGYLAGRTIPEQFEEDDTDCYLAYNNYISITPLNRHFYNDSLFKELSRKVKAQ